MGAPIQFFIIKKEYFRHQPYFFNHFAFHQHSCPMQIRGGMWGVECPVVRTTETYACIAQCDRGQWSEPCELYILRRKSETDFGRYTSYFARLSSRSIKKEIVSCSMYVSLFIRKIYFPFASRMPMLLPPENPLFSLLRIAMTEG